jgi:electron transfer flavoprotein alpha/beta subunit
VASFSLADLGLQADQLAPRGYRFIAVRPPERMHQVELLQGSPQEIATALLNKIRESL